MRIDIAYRRGNLLAFLGNLLAFLAITVVLGNLLAVLAISVAWFGSTVAEASPTGANNYEVAQTNLGEFAGLSNLGISGLDADRSIQSDIHALIIDARPTD